MDLMDLIDYYDQLSTGEKISLFGFLVLAILIVIVGTGISDYFREALNISK
ncbi:hypothetical protein [Methanosarcina mazei]|uniref:hypothetical protein n=1 Tax=Methanosarcina mazei TaxID=2209 RepID=UPI000AD6A8DD|nr:hypothetical protein [Methanosarcina mazei]